MSVRDDWPVLSARLESIASMLPHLVPALSDSASGMLQEAGRLANAEAHDAWDAVQSFMKIHEASLPDALIKRATRWSQDAGRIEQQRTTHADKSTAREAFAWCSFLVGVRAQMEYLLADNQAMWRSTVERAFLHLQRVIVVDEVQRRRWKTAHGKGGHETACEGLGATHLLWHGVWAFKAHAAGERTDLVMAEPVDERQAERAGTILVLTEWKRVTDAFPVAGAQAQIESQVRSYRRSSLASVELRDTCYGVLVTNARIEVPKDVIGDGYNLRFINIAVDPAAPSVAAKTAPRTTA